MPICRHYRAAFQRRGREISATVFLTERIGRARGAAEKTVCGRGKPPKLPSRKALWPQGLGGV